MESTHDARMENVFKDAWGWLGKEFVEFGFRWAVVAMFAFGFGGWFGKRYRALKGDVAALKKAAEERDRTPSISQTINIQGDAFLGDKSVEERSNSIQDAMDLDTVRTIRETIEGLPHIPMSGGGRIVRLPEHTLVVEEEDGSLLLAVPVSATFRSGSPRIEVTLEGGTPVQDEEQ